MNHSSSPTELAASSKKKEREEETVPPTFIELTQQLLEFCPKSFENRRVAEKFKNCKLRFGTILRYVHEKFHVLYDEDPTIPRQDQELYKEYNDQDMLEMIQLYEDNKHDDEVRSGSNNSNNNNNSEMGVDPSVINTEQSSFTVAEIVGLVQPSSPTVPPLPISCRIQARKCTAARTNGKIITRKRTITSRKSKVVTTRKSQRHQPSIG